MEDVLYDSLPMSLNIHPVQNALCRYSQDAPKYFKKNQTQNNLQILIPFILKCAVTGAYLLSMQISATLFPHFIEESKNPISFIY